VLLEQVHVTHASYLTCNFISLKVTVRCGCQTLKKEWLCQDVQAAYCSAGTDLKDVSKNQYGMGLLPCNSDCRSKVKVAEPELQHRKSKIVEVILIKL